MAAGLHRLMMRGGGLWPYRHYPSCLLRHGLGVQTTGDLRPINLQRTVVDLCILTGGVRICLQDESGVFQEFEHPECGDPPASEGENEPESVTLTALQAEIAQLKA